MKHIKSFFNTSVVNIDDNYIYFDNGARLKHYHEDDCCETHYLDFEHIKIQD